MAKLANTPWRLLRRKIAVATDSTVDDPDWQGLNDNPNQLTAVVGGTTSDGVYSITVTWFVGKKIFTATGSFERAAAETDAQIAAELETALDAATATDPLTGASVALSDYLTVSVDTATLTLTPVDKTIPMWFSWVDPGTATILFAPDLQLPICAPAPFVAGDGKDQPNIITISTHCLNASNVVLDPASSDFDIEVVEIATVNVLGSDGNWTTVERVVGSAVDTEVPVGCAYDLPISGSNAWTVRLLNVDALPATTTQLEVIYRTNVG